MTPHDVETAEGWSDAYEPRAAKTPKGDFRQLLGLLIGPLFVIVGIVGSFDYWAARLHFSDARRVSAVVTPSLAK
ncbi:hypothetical protein P3T36_007891 [Kitasatospora sp. MAP12-15]|uniref:hypothetical protein n=1 Tax=unclassified Kitasatospora TaxID=2633591 RepID=UPI00247628C1|nr:hypothetical protein [Kitasatospora sp. MAP12-44]MDH6115590.1 hypothetical protein [Kitasatospora sp. MAP12-44]